MKNKRALSPVIATLLLVSITLVLAAVVFFWARHFIGEAITKEGEKIELLCDDVRFVAEAYGGKLQLQNTGTVPIYAVEIRKKALFGDVSTVGEFDY